MSIKIKKILVPLDGSANSFWGLDVAIHMTRESQTTITGPYVITGILNLGLMNQLYP